MRLVLAALVLVALGQAPPATAQAPVGDVHHLPDGPLTDVHVDEEHGHVFITQGEGSDQLLVRDLDGAPLPSLPGLVGARHMGLSDDGTLLWVALAEQDALASIELATLQVTTYPTGSGSCPHDVAATGDLVWFSPACEGQQPLRALDVTTGQVHDGASTATFGPERLLESSPRVPNRVFVVDTLQSYRPLVAYDVVRGESPDLVPAATAGEFDDVHDLAIDPDGSRVVVTSRSTGPEVFDTGTLEPLTGWRSRTAVGNAVAFRPDGMVALGSEVVRVYRASEPREMRYYYFGNMRSVMPAGMAFGTERLYALSTYYRGEGNRLHVITPKVASTVTIKATFMHEYGDEVPVTVELDTVSPNRQVEIWLEPNAGPSRMVARGTVPADGPLELTVPRVTRSGRLAVRYAGDEDVDTATASERIAVAARVTDKAIDFERRVGKVHVVDTSQKAWLQTKVSPDHAGDAVKFVIMFKVYGRWQHASRTARVSLGPRSTARVWFKGGPEYDGVLFRMRAKWLGNKVNSEADGAWILYRFER